MKILSDDYSAWGKFAMRVYLISMCLLIGLGYGLTIPLAMIFGWKGIIIGLIITLVSSGGFFAWGMDKQSRELKKQWRI